MELHLKIVGYMCIMLAFVHVIFPKQFNWKKEMPAISLINQPLNQRYSLIIGGPTNTDIQPRSYGLFNHYNGRWSFVSNGVNNYFGLGSPGNFKASVPKSTLHIFTGDINIEQIGSGIIMKSPNGQCWRVTIDDTGNFVRTAITCP